MSIESRNRPPEAGWAPPVGARPAAGGHPHEVGGAWNPSSLFRRFGIALVAFAYAAAQLSFVDLGRALDWDESVYMSQVMPSVEALDFAASRARGIVALVWPLAAASAPLAMIRFLLVVLAAVSLYVAFRLWQPVIGGGAVLAAAVFAFAWPTLFYGSEIYPNLWSGLAAVAAAGALARWLQVPDRRWLAASATAFALMTLMRPIDAALAAVAVTALLGVYRYRSTLVVIAWIAAGCVLGAVPWVAEALARWGSISVALREAQGAVGGTGRGRPVVHEHLLLADGPLFGLDPDQQVSIFAAAWWSGLLLLSVVSVTAASSVHRRALLIPVVMGAASAAFYLSFEGAFAPRFLLPAYALLSVSAGAGMSRVVWRSRSALKAVWVAGAVALVPWTAWSIGVADALEAEQVTIRYDRQLLAAELSDMAGPGCTFASQYAFPQIAVHSSCSGTRYVPGTPVPPHVEILLARLAPGDPGVASCPTVTPSSVEGWYLYDCRRP